MKILRIIKAGFFVKLKKEKRSVFTAFISHSFPSNGFTEIVNIKFLIALHFVYIRVLICIMNFTILKRLNRY